MKPLGHVAPVTMAHRMTRTKLEKQKVSAKKARAAAAAAAQAAKQAAPAQEGAAAAAARGASGKEAAAEGLEEGEGAAAAAAAAAEGEGEREGEGVADAELQSQGGTEKEVEEEGAEEEGVAVAEEGDGVGGPGGGGGEEEGGAAAMEVAAANGGGARGPQPLPKGLPAWASLRRGLGKPDRSGAAAAAPAGQQPLQAAGEQEPGPAAAVAGEGGGEPAPQQRQRQRGFRWRGVDPVLPFVDPGQLAAIEAFYGLGPDCPVLGALVRLAGWLAWLGCMHLLPAPHHLSSLALPSWLERAWSPTHPIAWPYLFLSFLPSLPAWHGTFPAPRCIFPAPIPTASAFPCRFPAATSRVPSG